MDEKSTIQEATPTEKREAPAPVAPAVPVNRAAEDIAARKAEVLAFAPSNLRGTVDRLFLENPKITVEEAQKKLLDEYTRGAKAAGEVDLVTSRAAIQTVDFSEDEILRALKG